jgi:hypothetical protein
VLFLPVFWNSEEGYVGSEEADNFRDKVDAELQKMKKIPIFALFVGSLTLLSSFWVVIAGVREVGIRGRQVAPMTHRQKSQKQKQKAAKSKSQAPKRSKQRSSFLWQPRNGARTMDSLVDSKLKNVAL